MTVSDGARDTSSSMFNLTVTPGIVESGSNLTLVIVGNGKVSPDPTKQTLTIGRSYTITAMPAAGQAFAGWSGSVSSSAQRLTFNLKSNFVLQATFVPVTIVANGKGTVTPNLSILQTLMVGKNYTVTATPGSGQIFIGWTGSITSSVARLTFMMTSNVMLQANFIPNPYLAVAGSYNGLFHEADAVRTNSAGSFAVSVTTAGSYSGSVLIGTRKTGFSGKLSLQLQGASALTIDGTNAMVQFQLGTNDLADQIFGTLTADTFTSALQGDRAVFSSLKGHTSPFAGTYTLILPGQDKDPTLPEGDGYGTVRVSAAGVATFTGTLADGTVVSQSAPVSKNGDWPFYLSLYSGRGCMQSWLAFTNEDSDDINRPRCLDQARHQRASRGASIRLHRGLPAPSRAAPVYLFGWIHLRFQSRRLGLSGADHVLPRPFDHERNGGFLRWRPGRRFHEHNLHWQPQQGYQPQFEQTYTDLLADCGHLHRHRG